MHHNICRKIKKLPKVNETGINQFLFHKILAWHNPLLAKSKSTINISSKITRSILYFSKSQSLTKLLNQLNTPDQKVYNQ